MNDPDGVLALIDSAVSDFETSPDAMRWSPDGPGEPAAVVKFEVDDDELRDALRRIGQQILEFAEALKTLVASTGPGPEGVQGIADALRELASHPVDAGGADASVNGGDPDRPSGVEYAGFPDFDPALVHTEVSKTQL